MSPRTQGTLRMHPWGSELSAHLGGCSPLLGKAGGGVPACLSLPGPTQKVAMQGRGISRQATFGWNSDPGFQLVGGQPKEKPVQP